MTQLHMYPKHMKSLVIAWALIQIIQENYI